MSSIIARLNTELSALTAQAASLMVCRNRAFSRGDIGTANRAMSDWIRNAQRRQTIRQSIAEHQENRAVTPPLIRPATSPPEIRRRESESMRTVYVNVGTGSHCSRCGTVGHNRNNRECPLFDTEPNARVRVVRRDLRVSRLNIERALEAERSTTLKPSIQIVKVFVEAPSSEEECPICMECPNEADRVKTNCGHEFCRDCMKGTIDNTPSTYVGNVLVKKTACPICRANINILNCMSFETCFELRNVVA
jgi:hypothetical protein